MQHHLALFVAVVVVAMAASTDAARVTMIPHPCAASHVFLMSKIGVELSERGHQVTLLSANCDEFWSRNRTAGSAVNVQTYPAGEKASLDGLVLKMTKMDPIDSMFMLLAHNEGICEVLATDSKVAQVLSNTDVLFADITFLCTPIVHAKYNIKYRVDFAPTGLADPYSTAHWAMPNPLAYNPQVSTRLSGTMNFGDRLKNVITYGILYLLGLKIDGTAETFAANKLGMTGFSLAGQYRKSNLIVYPVDWSTEFARPVSPLAKLVGPILPAPGKPLPAELENFLQNAPKYGTVLVSLGTLMSASDEVVAELGKAFSQLPVNVLWTHKGKMPAGLSSNIQVHSWLPVNDLLAHPKLTAFVSHGGMNSIQEATYHGKPILCVPQFLDQFENVIRVSAQERGIVIDQAELTAERVLAGLKAVLEDPKYKNNALRVAKALKSRKRTSTQETVDWIEYVLETDGAPHLRPASQDMTWVVAGNWDVAAVLITLPLLLVLLLVTLVRKLCCGGKAKAKATGADSKKKN